MADVGGEPDALGARGYSPLGATTQINLGQITQATQQVNAFNASIATLQSTLTKFAQAAPGISSTISSSVNKISSAGSTGGGGATNTGLISSMFGSVNERGWARDLLMFPSRFIRSAVTDNRQLALLASAGLGPQAFGAGTTTQQMMSALAGQFGNVLGGSPADLVNLANIAGTVGAGINWRQYGGMGPPGNANAPRAAGFYRSVFEAQRMNPGADVGTLAGSIAGYAGNVAAQQQSAFLTGGAFSMIGSGNRQKSISEWAEGILKWLANLRPGGDRGKAFTYPELLSQNFPGSNIDAWLTANGVTADMKQYFWTYAMGRANQGVGGKADDLFTQSAAVNQSVAFNRLQASAAQTRTGFQLAGTMSGAYANKEQANRFFNEMMGYMLNQVLPTAMGSGALSFMQYLPDTVEEMIMQLAERTKIGGAAAGVVGWGSMFPQLLGAGDVGDVGDFGPMGGSSTAGLHPDARRRVDAMMAANPRLRVTSGFRDLGTQQRLKRKGVGRVSGRPSAHTRGMAADLGPRSEYGWIAANAGRFGLRSGARQGEPWHVGMGDVGDPVSDLMNAGGALAIPGLMSSMTSLLNTQFMGTISDTFSNLFSGIFGGGGPDAQIAAVGNASSLLMQLLMGVYGSDTPSTANLNYRDVYSGLVIAANKAKGLPTAMPDEPGATTGGWWRNIIKGVNNAGATVRGAADSAAGGTAAVGGATSLDAFFREVLSEMGAPVTATNLAKLAAVAKFEGNRASFNPFNQVSGPGSNFNSVGVKNYPNWGTGVDQLAHLFTRTDRGIPVMSTNIMNSGSYQGFLDATSAFYRSWGGPNIPSISQSSASEFLTHTVAGAGDIPDPATPMVMMGRSAPAPMFFQNNFKIDGTSMGTGIDMRRAVTQMADQLETEMRRRMRTTN